MQTARGIYVWGLQWVLPGYNPSALPCHQCCRTRAVKRLQPPKTVEERVMLSHCQSLSRALKLPVFKA